jgi:SecD/SecF fusion protein
MISLFIFRNSKGNSMEKQKRWQFYLIVAVVLLTLINILPTIFYYTKPLKDPVDAERARTVAVDIIKRVNSIEEDSKAWLLSFSRHLGLKPVSINLKSDDPGIFEVVFKNSHDAKLFQRYLPRAGSLIPFVPAQLELYQDSDAADNTVLVARQIGVHLDPALVDSYFHYFPKTTDGTISDPYRNQVFDRAIQLTLGFGGESRTGLQLKAITENSSNAVNNNLALGLAKEIVDYSKTFGDDNAITKRVFSGFTQVKDANKDQLIQKFQSRLSALKTDLQSEQKLLSSLKESLDKEGKFLDISQKQRLNQLNNQVATIDEALAVIKKNTPAFKAGPAPFTHSEIEQQLQASWPSVDFKEPLQTLDLEGRHPFVKTIVIDWGNDTITTTLYDDVQAIRLSQKNTEDAALKADKLNQAVINEIARVSRQSDETLNPSGNDFAVHLTELTNTESFLAFDLGKLSEQISGQILSNIVSGWQPDHADLSRNVFPVIGYETYQALSPNEQRLGLVVYAPAATDARAPQGFKNTSIYVIAKGLDAIIQKYRETPNAPGAEALAHDLESLHSLLKSKGFIAYPGSSFGIDQEFNQDMIFELDNYYMTVLNATREDFYVKGSKKEALLDFTNVEQRLITTNKIENSFQEDLLKWRDEYNAAQVDIDPARRYDVPPPTKNAFLENMKLSLRKYVRGDDRKILKWGLDLSGGKTVRIGLRDSNNRVVTDPDDLKQAVNELYTRINKMGVAERTIRIENNNIILDFPGSQALSAAELVKASAMYFHIVNEKFSPSNSALREETSQFLQNVWNEAVVTNRKDFQSINEIAWEQLGGNLQTGEMGEPRSEVAKTLYDQGLRISNPRTATKSSAFDDTHSSVAVMRGDDYSEWDGQTNPLIIVFSNYALEGSSLENVNIGYDPSEGNILSFGVKRSYDATHSRAGSSPRDDFYTWTSQFSEDKIAGTPKESYSQGRGWRMAVILNENVITKPNLRAALRDAATISGRFSQREINQLAADLKAGSLSFTPRILSEQNVSAELGKEERVRGIVAAVVGLILVATAMIGYYRFAGLVATCAVLFNLLIMWGVLQNLGAALTLPGIAGIVLTIGMAVDANVLVFERIREEFAISGRIASAIQTGYRKAFSAIVDSNVTTIIAAVILIQFDSGPIKGFAVTLIIGLVSSMFTALFMTRYFFAGWVKNPKNKRLNMAHLIGNTKFDFLSYTKPAVIISLVIIMVGGYLFYDQRNTMFGMDFTGGYSLNVEMEDTLGDEEGIYRQKAINDLIASGAESNDFKVRRLSKPNQLIIQFSLGMEENGRPFHGMPETIESEDAVYDYESDPRISWVVEALESGGMRIQQSELEKLDTHWSMMSGQFSEAMRNNALMALSLALISILIYITFRFEFKYAVGAVIGLAHDVLITMGLYALFHKLGFPVQIDLVVIGAIMTIIGYSLNDTIIVFDRIREDNIILRKLSFPDIINHALNITLSRTIMTSGTTLLVLLSLVTLGGSSIFDFALVMTIGVIVGTISSLFIAGPVLLYFHNREAKQNDRHALKKA